MQYTGDCTGNIDRIEVASNLNYLPQILDWFDCQQPAHVPKHLLMELRFAMAEGFTNAVRHAHAHLPSCTPIILELEIASENLELRIWDQGAPFDLSAAFHETQLSRLSPLDRESQWGIIMLMNLQKNYDWEIQYTPLQHSGNCLVIRKSINPNLPQ